MEAKGPAQLLGQWRLIVHGEGRALRSPTNRATRYTEKLTRAGVTVHRIAVRPWRFDIARNATIALIPDDVDVCCSMDMDMFLDPGWRAHRLGTDDDHSHVLAKG